MIKSNSVDFVYINVPLIGNHKPDNDVITYFAEWIEKI